MQLSANICDSKAFNNFCSLVHIKYQKYIVSQTLRRDTISSIASSRVLSPSAVLFSFHRSLSFDVVFVSSQPVIQRLFHEEIIILSVLAINNEPRTNMHYHLTTSSIRTTIQKVSEDLLTVQR